jgi:hypothetical protein
MAHGTRGPLVSATAVAFIDLEETPMLFGGVEVEAAYGALWHLRQSAMLCNSWPITLGQTAGAGHKHH